MAEGITSDRTERPQFTSDQIVAGIVHAIRNLDFGVVPGLVKLLAVQDPQRAQEVLDQLHGRVRIEVQL